MLQVNDLSRRLIETNYESEDFGGSSGDLEAHFKQLVKSSEIWYHQIGMKITDDCTWGTTSEVC